MIAVLEEESGKKKKVVEEKCGPPTPRSDVTWPQGYKKKFHSQLS